MNELDKIAPALVAIAAELKNPGFDSTNPHFKNRYPSLAGVRDTITPVAQKNGIVIFQNLISNAEGVGCETILLHSSGQSLKFGPLYLPASKHDPQGFGSCATYARRYALLAAFNVVGDDDDDANAGTTAHRSEVAAKPNPTPPAKPQTRLAGRTQSELQVCADSIGIALSQGLNDQLWKMHETLNESPEDYGAVGKLLSPKDRNLFKDIITGMQEERRARPSRNGRSSEYAA